MKKVALFIYYLIFCFQLFASGREYPDYELSIKSPVNHLNEKIAHGMVDTGGSYRINRVLIDKFESRQSILMIIKGTVVDDNNNPLQGASITVKGTNKGATSDTQGKFSIDANPQDILVISYTGFKTAEIEIKNQTEILVQLQPSYTSGERVVVIGYGTSKKKDLTGSVANLKESDFNKGAHSSVEQMMTGRIAGVRVTQSSAEPGGGLTIQIRGAGSLNAGNQPLYVIDGLPIDNSPAITGSGARIAQNSTPRNPLSTLNPEDIESITVLKDASASAIYGSRGSNGVIIITTKSGGAGKAKISYNGSYGVNTPIFKIRVLTAQEYMKSQNEIIDAGGANPDERVTGIKDNGTDWQEELLRTSATHNHTISIGGGNERSRYNISLNYFNQEGVVINSSMKRYSANINLQQRPSEKFSSGINLVPSYVHTTYIPGGLGGNENAGAMATALTFDPTLEIFDSSGKYVLSPFISTDNPLALANEATSFDNSYRVLGSAFGELRILPGWKIKLNVGGDFENTRRDTYVSKLALLGASTGGTGTVLTANKSSYLLEATTSYDRKFSNSTINAVAGITRQNFSRNSLNSNSSNFPVETMMTNSLQSGDQSTFSITTSKSAYALLSYLFRVNYTIGDKFIFTGSMRSDGSSKFGENNKYGIFPAFAGAWRLGNEEFIKKLNLFDDLKVRASWGRSGNQDIGVYQSLTTFGAGPLASLGQSPNSTFVPRRIGNPDLKWETTEQIDIGLDMSLLDNRLNVTADYFHKRTFDMLVYLPIPASTGFPNILRNVGSMKNTGMELTINSANLVGEFGWNTSLNMTTLRNEVLNIGGIPEIIGGGGTNVVRVGLPLYSFYGYKVIGVWQTDDDYSTTNDPVGPGQQKYLDVNGDGFVNADDRVILGNSFPKFSWGLSNGFSFKGVGLEIFVEGIHGVTMNNQNLHQTYFPTNFRRNKMAVPYLNRWTPTNPSNVYPSFINTGAQGNKGANSYIIQDASYVKLRNIRLSYDLPLKRTNRLSGIEKITFSVAAQNLLTITNYEGSDPGNNSSNDPRNLVDLNSYPASRSVFFGVSVNF